MLFEIELTRYFNKTRRIMYGFIMVKFKYKIYSFRYFEFGFFVGGINLYAIL